MSKNVFIKFAGRLLSKSGPAVQQGFIKDVGTFVQHHPDEVKAADTKTVVINQGPHVSQSFEHKSHLSFVAYNTKDIMSVAGHVDAKDPTKGEFFKPEDPRFIEKWGTLAKADPSAGGQKEGSVEI